MSLDNNLDKTLSDIVKADEKSGTVFSLLFECSSGLLSCHSVLCYCLEVQMPLFQFF